jgi:lysophospholipase L1-like esterase
MRYVGRFVEASDGGMSFEWSGSGIIAAFDGTSVSVSLDDGGNNEFTVVVDGELQPKLVAQAGSNNYELADALSPGSHIVELYRRTEASFGTSTFHHFGVGTGQLLAPPPPATHRIEIIGDSITCGYGNEGDSAGCGFSADTENHYATYGAIAARTLDAELVTIAWSGKGIVYNYDTDTNDPLPALYDRALPTQNGSTWDFSWLPEAVVINLGTNDFSTDGDPTPELFRDEYTTFLAHLREVYAEAYILCTVGPLLGGTDLDAARAGIAAAVAARTSAGDAQLGVWEMNISNDDPGCDYHPGLATHEAMGNALVTELKTRLGW